MTLDPYLVGHVRDALAADERTGVLDVEVTVAGSQLVLRGNVPTPERREAVAAVAGEVADGHVVVNEVVVLDAADPLAAEELA